uniref:Serum response factor homolog n=1 Tax=Caenorhabditis japonica TaxID=281687 RepID=A0A8R1DPE1_CAEJA
MTEVEDFSHLLQKLQNSASSPPEGASPAPTSSTGLLPNGKKTKGRVKIKMEYISNKLRRYTTFSKRKTGIMKKAFELSTLTGTQVMLLVASETGHVYTYATKKLQPMISSDAGKAMIQTCLNAPGEGTDVQPSRTEFTFDPINGGNGMRKRKFAAAGDALSESSNGPSMTGFSPFLPTMAPLFSTFGEEDYNNDESGDDSDSEEASSDIKEDDHGSPTMVKQEPVDTDNVTAVLQQTIKEAMRQAASNRQQQQKKARISSSSSSSPKNNQVKAGFLNPFLLQGLFFLTITVRVDVLS